MALHLLTWLLALVGLAAAQDVDTTQPDDALVAARSRLAALDPAEKDWREAVATRVALLEELLRTRSARAGLPAPESSQERLAQADAELERLRQIEVPAELELTDAAELPGYEHESSSADAREAELRAALDELVARSAAANTELEGLPARQSAAAEASALGAEPDELGRYRAASAMLEKQVVGERRTFLAEAAPRWSALRHTLERELELAATEAARARERLAQARASASRLREAEAREARRKAEQNTRAAEGEVDPLERFRLRIQAEVSEREARSAELRTLEQELKSALEAERASLERLVESGTRLGRRRGLSGPEGDELLRRILASRRRALRLLHSVEAPDVVQQQAEIGKELTAVLDRQWVLKGDPSLNEDLRLLERGAGPARREEVLALNERLLEGTGGLLGALGDNQLALERADSLVADLREMQRLREDELSVQAEEIEKWLLWIRSYGPINPVEALRQLAALVRDVAASGPPERARAAAGRRTGMLLGAVGLLLARALLGRSRRRASPRAAGAAPSVRSILLHDLAGLLHGLMLPASLWLLARVAAGLHATDDPPAVEVLLETLAAFALVRGLGRALFSPRSLLVHWRLIREGVAHQLRRALGVFTWAGIFLYAPGLALHTLGVEYDELLWVFEMPWLGALVISVLTLLRPKGALSRLLTTNRRGLSLLWNVSIVFILFEGCAILLSYGLGYRTGARVLLHNTMLVLAAAAALLSALALLWRLSDSLARWQGRPRGGEDPESELVTSRVDAIRFLCRAMSLIAVASFAVALQGVWKIGSPVGVYFARVNFEVGDGYQINLLDVVHAALWIVIGHLVVGNLTRIFESIAPRSARRGHRGTRMAWLTLAGYGILLLAYAAALVTLRVDLTTLGWLLTAISVGLGFGLQEIVANFVSGLILLFERPIRIGDVVTVGDSAGTVDRITIRSTVVTNWDRQTIVIPNKRFITENLINWTRTDMVVRRTVRVGIARGSDVERALRLLDELVRTQPGVLKSPPPRIWVTGFGEATLEIAVYAFCALDDGLRVVSELYRRILERLPAEGVEIPVPLRQVRLEDARQGPESGD